MWYDQYANELLTPFFRKGNWVVVALFAFIYFIIAHLYKSFAINISRISELIYCQTLSLLITEFIMYAVILLINRRLITPIPLIVVTIMQFCFIVIWCSLAHQWYFGRYKAQKTVIIWDERTGVENLIKQYKMEGHFDVVNVIHVNDVINNIPETLKDVNIVFMCDLHSHERNQIVKYCVATNKISYILPRLGDAIMSGAEKMHLFHLPVLKVGRYNPTPEYLFVKRAIDIILSAIALILASPIMLILAIIIKSDGGTAFYKQKRLTKNGKEFNVLKFRSMRMDAEKDGVARLSTGEKDDRITPVGKFIRAVRFDELPQLINILRGDMSIVGPRPERPEICKQYEEVLPEWPLRLQAKCGLTGYAQVYGQYNTTPYDKLMLDLMYIAKPSLAEDFKIIMATVKILFLPESTEGIKEGSTTAMDNENEVESSDNCAEMVGNQDGLNEN